MRLSYGYLVGVSAVAGAVVVACSSSSSPSAAPGGGDSGPTKVEDAGCVIDADLSIFTAPDAAVAGCATCLLDKCDTQIRACEKDCLCGDYYGCVAVTIADAGLNSFVTCAGNMAQTAALESNGPNLAFYTCFTQTCGPPCGVVSSVDAAAGGG